MRAKYILRGLGLGIIITAVVMGAYTRSAVADARVKVLKEYGIGEEAVLTETLVNIEGDDKEEAQDDTDSDTIEVIPFDEEPMGQTAVPNEEGTSQEALPSDESANAGVVIQGDAVDGEMGENASGSLAASENLSVDTVTIVISKGDASDTVARKLYSAGLVENAGEFDAFLMQHGYDKKISPGTKTINKNASWQEIAEKVTR